MATGIKRTPSSASHGPGRFEGSSCILAGSAGERLAEEVCGLLGVPQTGCKVEKFNDGECSVQIEASVRGFQTYVMQSTCHPVNDNVMELSLIMGALRRASAERIVAVVPYYGYGRQTRKMTSRVPISAADVATILEEQGLDQIVTVDVHAGQIAGFFSPRCSLDNLSVIPAAARFFWQNGQHGAVVIAPHATGVARAKEFYDELQLAGTQAREAAAAAGDDAAAGPPAQDATLAMLLPTRESDGSKRLELIGEVAGREVIIVDSLIDSGGTIARGAAELKARGAARVFAFATHGLFTGEAFNVIADADVDLVVTTNTVANVASALPVSHPARRKLAILSVAPILAHHMAEIAGLPAPEIDPATPVFSMHGFSDARECPHPPPSPPPLPPL